MVPFQSFGLKSIVFHQHIRLTLLHQFDCGLGRPAYRNCP